MESLSSIRRAPDTQTTTAQCDNFDSIDIYTEDCVETIPEKSRQNFIDYLIKNKKAYLIGNYDLLNKWEAVNHSEVALKIIQSGEPVEVLSNLGDLGFRGLSIRVIEQLFEGAPNLRWVEKIAIHLDCVHQNEHSNVARLFLLNAETTIFLIHHLNNFYDLDNDILTTLIDRGFALEIARHVQRYPLETRVEIAFILLEKGQIDVVDRNLDSLLIGSTDHNDIFSTDIEGKENLFLAITSTIRNADSAIEHYLKNERYEGLYALLKLDQKKHNLDPQDMNSRAKKLTSEHRTKNASYLLEASKLSKNSSEHASLGKLLSDDTLNTNTEPDRLERSIYERRNLPNAIAGFYLTDMITVEVEQFKQRHPNLNHADFGSFLKVRIDLSALEHQIKQFQHGIWVWLRSELLYVVYNTANPTIKYFKTKSKNSDNLKAIDDFILHGTREEIIQFLTEVAASSHDSDALSNSNIPLDEILLGNVGFTYKDIASLCGEMWRSDRPSTVVLDRLFQMIHQGGSVFTFGSGRITDVIGARWGFFNKKDMAVSVDEIYSAAQEYCQQNKEFDQLYERYQRILSQEHRL